MLIRDARLLDGRRADIRIMRNLIEAIGDLPALPGEPLIDAAGGLLLPGLHDHHIHVPALAAAAHSVPCGPPQVHDAAGLAAALARTGTGWLRGTGYHESVAGLPNRAMLDAMVPERPLRIQHRGGRMWFFNSAGVEALRALAPLPAGFDIATGRLFEGDAWLRQALGSTLPDFAETGAMLARHGLTGMTEMSPANDSVMAAHFASEQARGALPQSVLFAGRQTLTEADMGPAMRLGPVKLHLHEADLPPYDDALALIRAAHASGRPVAVHCVSEVELVFTLALFDEAGTMPGDRIEHASVAPDSAVDEIARLRLHIVSQPHFIAERGDAYRRDVEPEAQGQLYRLRAFLDRGTPLAGGSDAPFGRPDPWAAIAAAVSRRTADGTVMNVAEALTPEEALDLFLRDPVALDRRRAVTVGATADLCLLDRPWAQARDRLTSADVRATLIGGRIVHDRIDQSPLQRRARADTAA